MDNGKQATTHAELIEQIMDPRVPKNEREWAAAREIAALRARLAPTPVDRDEAERLLTDLEHAMRDYANSQHAKYLESRAAVIDAMTRATPIWYPMETLVHEHVDDKPLTVEGKIVPATYASDPVILTNGKRVWVERSVVIGGARSSSADKFTAYPSGDKPTHWQPLPAAPEAP